MAVPMALYLYNIPYLCLPVFGPHPVSGSRMYVPVYVSVLYSSHLHVIHVCGMLNLLVIFVLHSKAMYMYQQRPRGVHKFFCRSGRACEVRQSYTEYIRRMDLD